MHYGETWQEAAVREVREEAGIIVAAESTREFRVRSAPDGTILLFGISAPVARSAVAAYQPTEETSACLVVDAPVPGMAFSLHAEAVSAYFKELDEQRVNLSRRGAPAFSVVWLPSIAALGSRDHPAAGW